MRRAVVATFNIRHGLGLDGRVDLERTAGTIRSLGARIVALHEVDRGWDRSGNAHQDAELERLTGMDVFFGDALNDPERGGYGNAVLMASTFEVHNVLLPRLRAEEPRAAIVALSHDMSFVGTHLSRSRDARAVQLASLAELAAGLPPPVVIAGDMNAPPRGLVSLKAAGFRAGPRVVRTIPSRFPRSQIDHILVSPGATIEEIWAPATDASDHRPLVASVVFS